MERKALWDEYVLTLKNTGTLPITLVSAHVFDLENTPLPAGVDPWTLEKPSEANWKHYQEAGIGVVMGSLGTVAVSAGLGAAYYLGGSAIAGTALAVVPVVLVGNIVYVQVSNSKNRKAVEAEFVRRQLPIPNTIFSEELVSGSLFFPPAPGPKRLRLRYDLNGQQHELSFDLKETPVVDFYLEQTTEPAAR